MTPLPTVEIYREHCRRQYRMAKRVLRNSGTIDRSKLTKRQRAQLTDEMNRATRIKLRNSPQVLKAFETLWQACADCNDTGPRMCLHLFTRTMIESDLEDLRPYQK
jgi:hypothetical protein